LIDLPTNNSFTYLPSQDVFPRNAAVWSTDQISNGNTPVMVLKFSGCTPNTNIGSVFIRVGVSFMPVAWKKGFYPLQRRGSY